MIRNNSRLLLFSSGHALHTQVFYFHNLYHWYTYWLWSVQILKHYRPSAIPCSNSTSNYSYPWLHLRPGIRSITITLTRRRNYDTRIRNRGLAPVRFASRKRARCKLRGFHLSFLFGKPICCRLPRHGCFMCAPRGSPRVLMFWSGWTCLLYLCDLILNNY